MKRFHGFQLFSIALFLSTCFVFFAAESARAGIYYTGQIDPDDPAEWNGNTDGYVGKSLDGELTVDEGSELFARYGYIGYETGVSGAVTVNGEGSKWTCEAYRPFFPPFDPFIPGIPGSTLDAGLNASSSDPSGSMIVGYSGHGSLNITNGGGVINSTGVIGFNAGSTGVVTVDGTGSSWACYTAESYTPPFFPPGGGIISRPPSHTLLTAESSIPDDYILFDAPLVVGSSGSGELHITNGGTVTNSSGYIGFNAGSTGAVAVDGPDSTWISSGDLYIGYSGSGSLNVSGGAQVSVNMAAYVGYQPGSTGSINFGPGGGTLDTRSLYASAGQLTGEGTINARGLVSDLDLTFDAENGPARTIAFGGVTLNLDLTGSSQFIGDLGVGYRAVGSLEIRDGVTVNSRNGFVGFASGSTGTATVDGSTWDIADNLNVGYCGSGTLSIAGGGTVDNISGYIGNYADSSGTVSVAGPGSTWSNSRAFYVGNYGSGTLNITGGGAVAVATAYSTIRNSYIGCEAGSSGAVSIDGADSTWTNQGSLYVGNYGDGVLNISGGAVVTVDESTYLAYQPGSTGAINFGPGGGTLNTQSLMAESAQLTGEGTINARGLVGDVSLTFNSVSGPVKLIELKDFAGQNIAINLDMSGAAGAVGELGVGYRAAASLNINDGVPVRSTTGYLGYHSGSTGTAEVAGPGSAWNNSGTLYVGNYGVGSLAISGGATVRSFRGYVGNNAGSSGTVTIDGDGSAWTCNSTLCVGCYGDGSLAVTGGADFAVVDATADGFIGSSSGSTGAVSLDGDGSTLTVGDSLYVGYSGVGSLAVTGGAAANSGSALLGRNSGSTGEATVDGSGSTWNIGGSLEICNGSLDILNGAAVYNSGVGYINGAAGEVAVDGPNSTWTNGSDLRINDSVLNISNGGAVSVAATTELYGWTDYAGSINFGPGGGTLDTASLRALPSQLRGTGTINARGWRGDFDVAFDAASGPAAMLLLDGEPEQHVELILDLSGNSGSAGDLGIGYGGAGSMTVRQGVAIKSASGEIGYCDGSSGRIEIDGAGSSWTITGGLCVGRNGNGTLDISNGAAVENAYATIAGGSTSTAAVTVDGGSTWTNSGKLTVGNNGNGTLTISNGAAVSNTNGYIGNSSAGIGAVSVDGGSTWTNSGNLWVGNKGNGTLTIANGAAVSNTNGYIGNNSAGTGVVSVDGATSSWTNSGSLYVGDSGVGTLNISGGAAVSVGGDTYVAYRDGSSGSINFVDGGGTLHTGGLWATANQLNGTGAINTIGLVSDVDIAFDATTGSSSTITLAKKAGNNISINLDLSGSSGSVGNLGIGYQGNGSLNVSDIISIYSNIVYIGYAFGSSGTAAIDNGSSWTNKGSLYVGYSGDGSLDISAGGKVGNTIGYIGYNAGSSGAVAVVGDHSTWTNTYSLYVGRSGNGSLDISAAGAVINYAGRIGYNAASTGTATVDGANSNWTNIDGLSIGYKGAGSLNLINGGTLVSNSVYGGSGVMTLNFDGGVMKPYNASNATWLTQGSNPAGGVFVLEGGAKFDTAGYNMGIGIPLRHAGTDPLDGGLTKLGPGTLTLSGANTYTGATVVAQGTLRLKLPAQDAVFNLGGADIQATDAVLVFDYAGGSSPAETVRSLLAESFAADWRGGRLQCSIADGSHGLGWIDDAGAKTLSIKYALYGDANFDNSVDLLDLTILGGNWRGDGKDWIEGDFNYDGAVDLLDLTMMGGNWRASDAGMSFSEALKMVDFAPVPEPGTLALLLAAASVCATIYLRRKRQ